MALWLDLIPRIHRPDAFDVRYHLLDDWDNVTTFEEEGTRRIDLEELVAAAAATTTTGTPPRITVPRATQPPRTLATRARRTSTTPPPVASTAIDAHPATARPTVGRPPSTRSASAGVEDDDDDDGGGGSSSFGLTVAIGGALFVLNLSVFVAAYCQWTRMRRSTRRADNDKLHQELESRRRQIRRQHRREHGGGGSDGGERLNQPAATGDEGSPAVGVTSRRVGAARLANSHAPNSFDSAAEDDDEAAGTIPHLPPPPPSSDAPSPSSTAQSQSNARHVYHSLSLSPVSTTNRIPTSPLLVNNSYAILTQSPGTSPRAFASSTRGRPSSTFGDVGSSTPTTEELAAVSTPKDRRTATGESPGESPAELCRDLVNCSTSTVV